MRPMEEKAVRNELRNLKQGKMTPQELNTKILELEERAAIKLTDDERYDYYTNALRKDIFSEIMKSESKTSKEHYEEPTSYGVSTIQWEKTKPNLVQTKKN